MVDLTVNTSRPSSLSEVLDIFVRASEGTMAGVLSVSDQELVSSDLLGSHFSTIVDSNACLELNPQVIYHQPKTTPRHSYLLILIKYSSTRLSHGMTMSGDIPAVY